MTLDENGESQMTIRFRHNAFFADVMAPSHITALPIRSDWHSSKIKRSQRKDAACKTKICTIFGLDKKLK